MPKCALDLYCIGVQRPFLDFWRNLPNSENSPYFTRFVTISPKVIFDPPNASDFLMKFGFHISVPFDMHCVHQPALINAG